MKTFDTFVFSDTTLTSGTLFEIGFGFLALPISTWVFCGLISFNEFLGEEIMSKHEK